LAFIRRYQGLGPVTYPHPSLEPVLRDAFGLVGKLVYVLACHRLGIRFLPAVNQRIWSVLHCAFGRDSRSFVVRQGSDGTDSQTFASERERRNLARRRISNVACDHRRRSCKLSFAVVAWTSSANRGRGNFERPNG
jgi:hypothetical protein